MPHTKNRNSNFADKGFFYLTVALTLLGLIAVADSSAPQALNVFNDKKEQNVSIFDVRSPSRLYNCE
jgi:hypothetical protein